LVRKLRDSAIVVTGGASGIGLATSYALANRGASLVLAGRQGEALNAVAAECRERGVQTIAVPTDVTDEAQVQALARRAVESFGRIDLWVNNAAVTAFGAVGEVPMRVFRRVIETNLYGYLHGIRAALPLMREQGAGIIVNVLSGAVFAPQPYTAAYVASKHAIKALTDCLRLELLLTNARDIHLCNVYPASVDTPLFQRGANYSGRAVKPMPPVHEPEEIAAAIVAVAERPRRAVYVGVPRRTIKLAGALAPDRLDRKLAYRVDHGHFQDRLAMPSEGNLFKPLAARPELRGGWGDGWGDGPSHWPSPAALLAGAVLAAGAGFLAWRGSRRGLSSPGNRAHSAPSR
jgi:NAD(P)-dependent dehydrogenase (short-subunit alcohol dehydrogenase family)